MACKNSERERGRKDNQRIRSEASLREIGHVLWPNLSTDSDAAARTYQIRLQNQQGCPMQIYWLLASEPNDSLKT